jgi:serine protease Do
MGASLTIPAKLAWNIAKSIEEHGGVKRGYLGIRSQLVEVSADAGKSLMRAQGSGLLVMSVEKDSPAAVAGLIVGDLIVGFAGQPVADHDELLLQLNSGVVGKSLDLEVLRGGKPQIVKVTIGEHNEAGEHEHHHHGRHSGRHFGHRRWRR